VLNGVRVDASAYVYRRYGQYGYYSTNAYTYAYGGYGYGGGTEHKHHHHHKRKKTIVSRLKDLIKGKF
jgi:hypothetical protein